MTVIDERILSARDHLVDQWRTFCRFETVSGNLPAITEAAAWLESRLAEEFDSVTTIDIPDYGPVVVATAKGASDDTLMLYNHYDVQPAGDADAWQHPPFGAEIHDNAVYARGACDDKADVTSRIEAFRLWKKENNGLLPYSVIYLADPCEEIGSPGLERVLAEHTELLRSDACLWESYLREEDGSPAIGFGCRGVLEIEIRLTLLSANIHPSYASIIRSAPLEMMRLIASFTTDDGRIAIPGMRELAMVPSEAATQRAHHVTVPDESIAIPGVNPHHPGDPAEKGQRFVFEPAMSLSGYDVDPSISQTIANACTAKVRFNLVPGMDPERCLELITRHVASLTPEAEVHAIRMMKPAYSSADADFGQAVAAAAARAFEATPVIYDVMTGAGPGAIFLEHLGAPIISPTGTLRPDGNMHGFNEHGNITDYLTHIQFTLDILRELERRPFGRTTTTEAH